MGNYREGPLVMIITGLSTGGAEMMLLKVLEKIDRYRFSPHVVSLTTKGQIGARIEALGIPVEALGMRSGRLSPIKFLRLVRRLRRLRPSAVHTWMYHADLLGGLAARLARVRTVGWAIHHSNLSPLHNKRSTLWVMKACAALSRCIPRKILCCSQVGKDIHVSAGYDEKKMVVIPNGFDLAQFKPDSEARVSVRRELGLAEGTPLVGLIARYDPQKNHTGFLEAAARVHRSHPEAHFLLAGTGVEVSNSALRDAIQQAGVRDETHLLGRREDTPRLMAALDVLTSSSSFGEAFPIVLGEAMACGVPCVVADVGDSAEIVGETGRVAATGDMAGLAHHIVEILELSCKERRVLGKSARERIQTRYDIGSVVRQYEGFYENLVRQEPITDRLF